ncbi:MAG TPA: hypothetical protein VGH19_07500 [Verrucomicrobiae bacterium]
MSTRQIIYLIAFLCVTLLIFFGVRAWRLNAPVPIPTQPSACQTNLFLIDQAITRWAKSNHHSTTNQPTTQDIASYFKKGKFPTCPSQGKYQLGTLALATTCNIHGQTLNVAIYPKRNPVSQFVRTYIFMRPGSRFAPRNACIANMKQLDGAAQQWALENKMKDGDLVNPYASATYLKNGQFLICPLGGKYSFTQVSNPPCCTITGHSLP